MNKNKTFIYQNLLKDLQTISLDELDKVKLLDRKDTKFVFNQNQLPSILEKIKPYYRILEINNSPIFNYDNTYFDTNDFLFYNQHHNEHRQRFKVRLRKYSNNNKSYFEIKIKNNKNRTVKKRILVNDMNKHLGKQEKNLVSEIIGLQRTQLIPILDIQFSRITLTDNNFSERLTIDTNLSVKNGKSSKIFDQLAISEIKQKKYDPKSDIVQILRDLKIPEMRFSKYCMGMLHVNKDIKYNRFKPKLLQINKILTQDEMIEKWNDILVNVKWSKKDDGFFKVWLNGKQVYSFEGPTKTKAQVYFKFGIYRSYLGKWIYSSKNKKKEKGVPAQVVYFDEVRTAAKSCKKLKLENLGYSCEKLESKQISKIEKGETSTNKYMAVIKSKNNENYLLKINGATKKLAKKKGLKQCKEEGNTECYVHYSGLKPDYEM